MTKCFLIYFLFFVSSYIYHVIYRHHMEVIDKYQLLTLAENMEIKMEIGNEMKLSANQP